MGALGSEWVLAMVFVLMFYGAGKHEYRFGGEDNSLPWCLLSIAVSALVTLVLHGTWGWLLFSQLALIGAITVARAMRSP